MFAAQTAWLSGCGPARPPLTREVVHLTGAPYQRGLQHGQLLKSKVRSLYTTLLASSIIPNLSREQPDLAAVFAEYRKERYTGGAFGYQLLLDSAHSLERSIPRAYQEEMHGIADGAGMPYEQVLVLNTFVDSLMGVRAVAMAARLSAAPRLLEVEVLPGLGSDDADNDGDGVVDEPGEGLFAYLPLSHAALVELPPSATVRLTLTDPDGVDPQRVRLILAGQVFSFGDPALSSRALPGDPTRLEVTLTPPSPLPPGAFELVVQAGDLSVVTAPAPSHARFMRDERLTFTTRGTGLVPTAVPNRGPPSSREHPPSVAFAAKGPATRDGEPLLAQHFALLDGNTAHKHTVVFVHHPEGGEPFAVVGWAGTVWGLSGMNARGLAGACNTSDTLDNSVVKGLLGQLGDLDNAKLLSSGVPVGIFQRMVLERDGSADAAVARAKGASHAFGWSCLYADAQGAMRALEVDSNFTGDGGAFDYGPGELAGDGQGTLRIGSHFRKNRDDMAPLTIAGNRVQPQRGFSSFYFRSLSAWSALGDELAARAGQLDAEGAAEVLGADALVDRTDSMYAVVYEPAARRLRVAIGKEPATDAPFELFSLEEAAP
ncbi:MAG: carcinine hydrolase/isopenicillin-N N-acyltransferase family protein [Myxococcaceae bacterium]